MRIPITICCGLIGAAISYFLLGEPAWGGGAGEIIGFGTALIGFIVGAVPGYLLATIPLGKQSAPQTPVSPPRHFRPQIAGGTCLVCKQRILFADEGQACEQCESLVHKQCVPAEGCPNCKGMN